MGKEDYDKVSVIYCSHCLSLAVKEEEGYDICQQCKNDEFDLADDIHVWENRFVRRYGVKYLDWKDE